MVRDRLAEMQAKSTESGNEKRGRTESNGTPLLSSEQQLTECLDRVTQIDNKIKVMKSEIEEMTKLQKNILSNPLIDKKEVKKLDQTADKVFNSSNALQKEITTYKNQVSDLHMDSNHERVVMTHLDRLRSDVSKNLNDFNAAQLDYIEKSKKLHNKKVEIVGGASGTQEADPGDIQASVFMGDDYFAQAQKEKMQLREIEQRDEEIKKIEKSVIEVNKLFKEINALIMEQGETIDTIEKHVESAVADVENADKQLKTAVEYQSKARRKKICCIGVIVAILLIAGIILTIVIVNSQSSE